MEKRDNITTDLLYLQMHKNPVATTEINRIQENIKYFQRSILNMT